MKKQHAGANWMAKICAMSLALTVVAAPWANATNGGEWAFSAKGSVGTPERITLTAPVGGQVENFAWLSGDAVTAEETALVVTPTQVFAAADGVIRGLQAEQGDQAGQVISLYGALCYIERDQVWQVRVSNASAHNKAENRDVRIGDTLRVLQGSGDNEVRGSCAVTQLLPNGFVVEMPLDAFELEKNVKFYRVTDRDYDSRDQVGNGKILRPSPEPVMGDGCVAEVLVEEGQRVRRGQPLFTLDNAAARHSEPPESVILFPRAGVVAEVLVRPGQFVVQGQAVITLIPTDALEVTLDVDELDIAHIAAGQRVSLAVDAYPDRTFDGTVREIKPLGVMVLDTTKFSVNVVLDDASGLLVGMRVTGYWIAQNGRY